MSTNIKCLTPQEEERFLITLRNRKDAERAYMLYHLMLITGLRLSEALSLNVEHASRIKVELKVKGWIKKGEKKDRFKTVYFPKALQEHLKDYLKVKVKKGESLLPEAPVFVSRNSARISPRQVQRDFKKWVRESGIESNLSPHSLRHTVGTRLLKEFKNAKLVQRYLGHSDVATTLRYYVDVFPEDLEEAAEMLAQK
ncbi:MAG: tyrosine-type recombinase/integrase [Proteobacteria bacterium]|nr:tyrosine-type recombinase/integrase [Pseudomonadota bacterium]MBU4288309.1 tyrosine-type recombinase/integrase [Pseudomonadota bacterium]MCG2713934.1 tyrosine-type recombinase/integrase [Candidatus Omnitrophota bacterium]